jgi:hypothetical protein
VNPKAGTTKLSVGWQRFGMLERIVCLHPEFVISARLAGWFGTLRIR